MAKVPNSVHPYRGSRAVGSLGPVGVAGLVQAGRWAQVCSGASPGTCSCRGGARVCRVANTTRVQVKPPAGRGLCFVHLRSTGRSKSRDQGQRQWGSMSHLQKPWQDEEEE